MQHAVGAMGGSKLARLMQQVPDAISRAMATAVAKRLPSPALSSHTSHLAAVIGTLARMADALRAVLVPPGQHGGVSMLHNLTRVGGHFPSPPLPCPSNGTHSGR